MNGWVVGTQMVHQPNEEQATGAIMCMWDLGGTVGGCGECAMWKLVAK